MSKKAERRVSDAPVSAAREVRVSDVLTATPLPASWLDTLLRVAAELPVEGGREAVVAALLDAVSEVLPEHAIGVCIFDEAMTKDELVVRRGIAPDAAAPLSPTRLFPSHAYELIVVIEGAHATLHAAHNDAVNVAAGCIECLFFERAAVVLGGALRQVGALDRARAQAAELGDLQAQIIQSEKLASLGQIAAGVVHELNNPLTSIVAYSEHLRKKGERDGAAEEDIERLKRIGEAANRILRFARDLGAYARPSSGATTLVRVGDIIEQALVFCEHVIADANVTVVRSIDGDPRPVNGAAGELTQVFVNLVTNACHAMSRGGRLVVSTRAEGELLVASVTDEGDGIEPRFRSKIFEPFFTTKSVGRGTGLGLSIVRNIVLRHGGTIVVESTPGEGATFIVRLPAVADFADSPTEDSK